MQPVLSLRQIEVFWSIVTARSVSGAARMLNVGQPGLSRMLKHTEDQLGFSLFHRSNGRLVATPEAMVLFEHAQRVHAQVEGLRTTALRLRQADGMSLTVGAGGSVANWPAPRALARVGKKLRGLALRLNTLSVAEMNDFLLDGRGDAVVSLQPLDHPALETEQVGEIPLLCAVPRGHALAAETRITAAKLRHHSIIAFDVGTSHGDAIRTALLGTSDRPAQVAAHARFAAGAVAMAEAGLGIALVDACALVGAHAASLLSIPFHPAMTFPVHLTISRRAGPSTAFRAFAAALRAELATTPWRDRKQQA
jgi:DNA-binding transcriptional LysR family regulator